MSNFTFNETKIKGVYIIDVKTYGDNRGYFMETYKESDFKEAGLDYNFVQDNPQGTSLPENPPSGKAGASVERRGVRRCS